MSAVSCSSSSAGIDEPGTGRGASGSSAMAGLSAVLLSIANSNLHAHSLSSNPRRVLAPARVRRPSGKEVVRLDQCLHQGVHLGLGIVHGEGGPARGRHAEPIHQGLSAMMAGTYGHTRAVDDGRNIVRVQAVD